MISALWRWRQLKLCKFKASLLYTANFRPLKTAGKSSQREEFLLGKQENLKFKPPTAT